jgi:hypothetical protein
MDPSQGPHESGAPNSLDARDSCDASQQWQPRSDRSDPPGAKWHKAKISGKRPSKQMFEQADSQGHEFMVASDCLAKDGSIKKMYASYPSSGDFIRDTLSKTENKIFYELIREGKPCKLFLDIEWIGRDDPKRRVIRHVVDKLKAYTKVRATRLHNSADRRQNPSKVRFKNPVHCTCFPGRFLLDRASFFWAHEYLHASKQFSALVFSYQTCLQGCARVQ